LTRVRSRSCFSPSYQQRKTHGRPHRTTRLSHQKRRHPRTTDGIKDAAGKLNEATGLGDKADELVGKVSGGKSAGDLVGQAKDLVADNKAAAGAVLGGLGLLILGTKGGRGLAKGAAAAGGAALIGGLAYKAFQNHKDGKPLIKRGESDEDLWNLDTPEGTDFAKRDKAHAEHYLRAMISAAAADGKIDDTERGRILSALDEADLEQDALEFLSAEFATPAAAEAFVFAAEEPELASQIYTAARLAIDPESEAEQAYLFDLAQSLALDNDLVAHLESAVDAARDQETSG